MATDAEDERGRSRRDTERAEMKIGAETKRQTG
jgi:hypothetical protein